MQANPTVRAEGTEDFHIRNIKDMVRLEQRERISMSASDKIASTVTAFSGSMVYVGLHIIWFAVWLPVNFGWIPGIHPFDPFPFSLLTMIVSLEAIFLSAFVLISQNKQAQQADKRAKIDLQVNMIAEQENTKLLEMVSEIQQHLGIKSEDDPEVQALKKATDVNALADALDSVEGHGNLPKSAADTES